MKFVIFHQAISLLFLLLPPTLHYDSKTVLHAAYCAFGYPDFWNKHNISFRIFLPSWLRKTHGSLFQAHQFFAIKSSDELKKGKKITSKVLIHLWEVKNCYDKRYFPRYSVVNLSFRTPQNHRKMPTHISTNDKSCDTRRPGNRYRLSVLNPSMRKRPRP